MYLKEGGREGGGQDVCVHTIDKLTWLITGVGQYLDGLVSSFQGILNKKGVSTVLICRRACFQGWAPECPLGLILFFMSLFLYGVRVGITSTCISMYRES